MADAHPIHIFTLTHTSSFGSYSRKRLHKTPHQCWQAREVAAKRKRWRSFAFSFTSFTGLQLSKLNELSVPAFWQHYPYSHSLRLAAPPCPVTECLFHRCRLLCCSVTDSYIVTHTQIYIF